MRTAELKQRLGITSHAQDWRKGLLGSHCLQVTHHAHNTLDWNNRDAEWLIRLYEQSPKKTGYYVTHLITKHHRYRSIPFCTARYLARWRKPGRCLEDQWHDQIHATAIRLRTYQIMLTTLVKDATEAGYEPLDSWTDTSLYDKREREQIVKQTREREPGA